jgi:hypothetical protein
MPILIVPVDAASVVSVLAGSVVSVPPAVVVVA